MSDPVDQVQTLADALAKQVTPDATLTKLVTAGEKPLNEKDAAKLINERLTGLSVQGEASGFEEAAAIIARALPANYRMASILTGLELRPYLMALDGQTLGHTGGYAPTMVNGQVSMGGPETPYVLHTKGIAEAETARIQQVLTDAGAPGAAQTAGAFSTNKAGTTPLVQLPGEAPKVKTVTGYDATGNPIYTTIAQDQAATGINVSGLRALVQGNYYDLGQLAADESKYQQTTDANAYFPVQINRGTARQIPDTVSVLDATNYLNNLTPEEITKVQLRLASGGYFDRLPNGGAYLEGDALDQNTVEAWKLLVTDAVKTNRPANQVLGQAASTYRDSLRKERLSQLAQYDPSYTAAIANDYAQSVAGADLSPDERASLDAHLQRLVSQRAGYIAGSGEQGQGLANTPQGFNEQDVQLAVGASPGLQRSQRVVNTQELSYKLKALLH